MNTILQAFLDAMVNDDGSGTAGDLMDKTWWTDLIGRIDTVVTLAGLSLEEDSIYYVSAASGSDITGDGSLALPWATIGHAIEALRPYRIPPGGSCTLQVDDGAYTLTESLAALPANLTISGKNHMIRSVTSVQSSSGSSGDYEIVLNLLDVSSIAAGDECAITSASGGTNPLALQGTFEIINVDTVNSRITIHSPTTVVPSGLVTATARIYKTLINPSGVSGLTADTDVILQNLALVGDDTADTYGVAPNGAKVTLSNVAIRNFGDSGVYCERDAQVEAAILTICACSKGINAQTGGNISAETLTIAHLSGYAVTCEYSSSIFIPAVNIFDCSQGIFCRYNGSVSADNAVIQGITGSYGATASYSSYVSLKNGLIAGGPYSGGAVSSSYQAILIANGATLTGVVPVIASNKGFAIVSTAVITTSGTVAIMASAFAYVIALGCTITGTLTPAANTQGNTYAYIQTTS